MNFLSKNSNDKDSKLRTDAASVIRRCVPRRGRAAICASEQYIYISRGTHSGGGQLVVEDQGVAVKYEFLWDSISDFEVKNITEYTERTGALRVTPPSGLGL